MTLKEYERKAALGALDELSEFRIVYWTDRKARYYTVRRDLDQRSDLWGIFDGDEAWTGESWDGIRDLPSSFRWDLADALKIARKLAYEENQRIVALMEREYPGQYKGSGHDFAATWTGAPRMTVNPEPLKVVEAKAGEKAPEPEYLFARRWRKDRLVAASVHKDGCKVAPEEGTLLDGSHWTIEKIPRSKVNQSVGWAADQRVEANVWCRTCGGWGTT